MKIVDLIQGTDAWHLHRAQHWNASDAPAMLGCSAYKTRAQLIREVATGVVPEVTATQAKRFADGHRAETLCRPLAEEIIGQELFPVTGTDGRFSASFDGLTMDQTIGFEHKSLNDELRGLREESLVYGHEAILLPLMYRVQMEQQMLVSGAEKILFMASAWEGDDLAEDPFWHWYTPDLELRAKIVAGWEQFEKDVAAYTPDAPAELITGNAPESLPALRLELTGMVTSSNLPEFKERALAVFGSIRKDLVTDQDFADAEQTVKFCEDVEKRIAGAKQHALSQTASIDELFRVLDEVSATARRTRLDLDKLVTAKKTQRKTELVQSAISEVRAYEAGLNAELGAYAMSADPSLQNTCGEAIKGKRSLQAMKDALDGVVANAKIQANNEAALIRENVKVIQEKAGDHMELFPDHVQLVLGKDTDDLANLIATRIEDKRKKDEERRQAEEDARAATQATPIEPAPAATVLGGCEVAKVFVGETQAHPPVVESKLIKLGELNDLIAPLKIDAEGLAKLGFQNDQSDKRAKLYDLAKLPAIVEAFKGILNSAVQRAAKA